MLYLNLAVFTLNLYNNTFFIEEKAEFKKNNLINFDVLKGHKYQIVPNSKSKKSENNYLYIWKYDNCNKSFSKTWNLVYHFRVHTNEKPFEWNHCGKKFSQKGNLGRHLETHEAWDISERKTFTCKVWKSTYTNIYNLKVGPCFSMDLKSLLYSYSILTSV